jgi:hypothetical protein
MMIKGQGLEVIDLGTDVSPEAFIGAAVEQDCRVIGCSARLTTTMGMMQDVTKEAEPRASGTRSRIPCLLPDRGYGDGCPLMVGLNDPLQDPHAFAGSFPGCR